MARLKWLDRMYPAPVLTHMAASRPDGSRIVAYLTTTEEGVRIWRRELDRYLEVAYRHHAVDADLQARLRSEHWNTFIQAVNEIQAAYFFERWGRFRLKFRPPGQGGSIGEFELIKAGLPRIFVEVKSPNRETPTGVWFGSDERVVRSNILRACQQIPTDGRPTLVVIAGELRVPVSEPFSGVIQALYGTPVLMFSLGAHGVDQTAVQHDWTRDGIFQPTSNQHLSAVATLRDRIGSPYLDSIFLNIAEGTPINSSLPRNQLTYLFRVYHNPYTTAKISTSIFQRWPQFGPLPDDPDTYGWLEPKKSRPSRRVRKRDRKVFLTQGELNNSIDKAPDGGHSSAGQEVP